jgi:hypothetical protein
MLSFKSISKRINHAREVRRFKKGLQIKDKYRTFHSLFHDSNGFILSKNERLNTQDDSLLYGEIDFESFVAALSLVSPKDSDIFYDLGAGTGKACLTAALVFKLTSIHGVEILSSLHAESQRILKRAPPSLQKSIHFVNADFLAVDITSADILFINATAFLGEYWDNIVDYLSNHLRKGTRLIVTSKSLPSPCFTLYKQTICLMSWGQAHIGVYLKN